MRTETIYLGVRAERYKQKVYRQATFVCTLFCAMLAIIFSVYHMYTVKNYEDQISALKLAHTVELAEIGQQYRDEINSLTNQAEEMSTRINQRQGESKELFELARKYWYVFRDAPDNSGLGMDDIVYLDDLCKEGNVNPHLMWCIYHCESGYTAKIDNSTSTARGLGQVLASTGKSMYENVLQLGSYDHTYAYDPQINMKITVSMISRNISSGLNNTIALYSGDSTGAYLNKLYNKAREHGVNISNTAYQ